MTPAQTIGILGGTFNPVHIGHLRLATAVAEALRLKHVDLMPCAVPPHKADSGLLSFEMRVSLLQGALETPGRGPRVSGAFDLKATVAQWVPRLAGRVRLSCRLSRKD